jgi:hypothetical protein
LIDAIRRPLDPRKTGHSKADDTLGAPVVAQEQRPDLKEKCIEIKRGASRQRPSSAAIAMADA